MQRVEHLDHDVVRQVVPTPSAPIVPASGQSLLKVIDVPVVRADEQEARPSGKRRAGRAADVHDVLRTQVDVGEDVGGQRAGIERDDSEVVRHITEIDVRATATLAVRTGQRPRPLHVHRFGTDDRSTDRIDQGLNPVNVTDQTRRGEDDRRRAGRGHRGGRLAVWSLSAASQGPSVATRFRPAPTPVAARWSRRSQP